MFKGKRLVYRHLQKKIVTDEVVRFLQFVKIKAHLCILSSIVLMVTTLHPSCQVLKKML